MLLKYFYDNALAQASYLIGCDATGQAMIIDPMRHIQPYLEMAEAEGVRITHITETHIHADFASGAVELATHTGGTLYLSDMGDADWKYAYPTALPTVKVQDGDTWQVGTVLVKALHTPGHTPEHLSFLITDTATADRPIGLFTGDFIFVGDVGRPDLLEEAAGMVGTREVGARQQFHSVQASKAMPDYLQVWPGHGAGSACGKALGAIPSTTLGYEKLFSHAFQLQDEAEFVDWLLAGQPEAPRYFAQMKVVNKTGWPLLASLPAPTEGTANQLAHLLQQKAVVIDCRPRQAYADNHLRGTLSIPSSSSKFSTYVGWFVDYEQPLYLVVMEASELDSILQELRAIGVDHIPTFFTESALVGGEALPVVTVEGLAQSNPMILDVRGQSEYEAYHIQGARNIPLGHLPRHLDDLPRDRPIVTQCASGYRAQVAASFLRRAGFDNITNLVATEQEWSTLLPTE